jgi:hypothetical protein
MDKSDIYRILSLKCLNILREVDRKDFWKIYGDIYRTTRSCIMLNLQNYPNSVIDYQVHLLPFIDKIDEEEYLTIGMNCEKHYMSN